MRSRGTASVGHPRILLASCIALGVVSSGSCREIAENTGATVTVQYPADEGAAGPNWDLPAKFLVFLPLVAQDAEGEFEGRLARSWEPSEDYRTWTVHLNTDVRWHDGVPVTADDIAFTVELLSRPAVGYLARGEVTITVLDDSTFAFTSTQSSPLDDYQTYYPKHLLEALDPATFYGWDFWTQPVGNGPYRYVRHVPKTMTELEGNPDYFRGKPAIERVFLKYGTGGSGLPDLLAGEVDAIQVNPMDLPKVEDDPRFHVTYKSIYWDEIWKMTVFWNHRHPAFADTRVRRAATLAIDRRELLDALNLPPELPLADVPFTKTQWKELPEPLVYDPDAARRLLEEAGWRDTDGDGVRERYGEALHFTALTQAGKGDRVAVFLQEKLSRVGMRMEIETVPGMAMLFSRLRAGDWDAAVSWWTPGTYRTFGPNPFLEFGYRNSRVVELVEAIETTAHPAVEDSLFRELWPHFRADVPVTFLYPLVTYWVSDRRLKGLSSPFRGDPVWYLEELWIEEDA